MRIGLNLLYMLPGVVGGTETYAAGLLEGLAAIDRTNQYIVFVNREAARWPLPRAGNIIRMVCAISATNRAKRYFYEQVRFPSLVKKYRVDVLHSLGYVGPLNAPCPAVVTVPDLNYMSERHAMSWSKRHVLQFFSVQSTRNADAVITISDFSKGLICQKLGIPDEKVVVTLLGPRCEASLVSREAAGSIRARYEVPDRYLVAFAGGAVHKNIPRLLQAFAKVRRELSLKLVLIGHFPPDVGRDDLLDGVIATGYVPDAHIMPLLGGAYVFILPSLYEGFGLPVLEAQQAGVPVVCSKACSLPEVAGEAAVYFDPCSVDDMADRILSVARDEACQDDLRRKGYANIQRFSWEKTARETLDVYDIVYVRQKYGSIRLKPAILPSAVVYPNTMAEPAKQLVLGIDASNIGSGGSLGHLDGILRHADFAGYGFSKVHVFCNRMVMKYLSGFQRPGVFVHPQEELIGSVVNLMIWQVRRLPELARAYCPDILWSPGGIGVAAQDGIPRAMLLQNVLPFELHEASRYGWRFARWKMMALRQVQKKAFRSATGVMLLTNYARDRVLICLPEISGKHVIIPHGIDDVFFRDAPKPRWPEKLPVRLLYVSTVDVYKHQWRLCEAVDVLISLGYKLELDLVGGAYPPALRRLNLAMKKMSHGAGHVHYRGGMKHSKLPAVYHAADIFVFPSSCEAMPIVMLEAMAAGLPIACSNRGPMPEILGDAGVYFDPEDAHEIATAVQKLIDDPQMAYKMAQCAHARAKEYSWERCAHETLQYLRSVADKQNAPQTACVI